MLLQIFSLLEVRITEFCSSLQEDSGVNKFCKPFVFENLFYLPKIAIGNTSLEITSDFHLLMYEIEKSVSKNRETLHERFSGSIGNDFIPHMNC